MHNYFILGGLLHATVLAVIGFFILFAASRSEGLLRLIGNVLGVWLFIVAVLALVGGFFGGPLYGAGPMGWRMMGGHRPPWMQPGQPIVAPTPAGPAAPATAPSAAPAGK